MLARDWYYTQRRRVGLDSAVASIYDRHDDSDERDVDQWADFAIKNHDFQREGVVTHMRDEYSTFGWVIERMLTDIGFKLESVDYHAPLHGTYLLRKPKAGEQS